MAVLEVAIKIQASKTSIATPVTKLNSLVLSKQILGKHSRQHACQRLAMKSLKRTSDSVEVSLRPTSLLNLLKRIIRVCTNLTRASCSRWLAALMAMASASHRQMQDETRRCRQLREARLTITCATIASYPSKTGVTCRTV